MPAACTLRSTLTAFSNSLTGISIFLVALRACTFALHRCQLAPHEGNTVGETRSLSQQQKKRRSTAAIGHASLTSLGCSNCIQNRLLDCAGMDDLKVCLELNSLPLSTRRDTNTANSFNYYHMFFASHASPASMIFLLTFFC